MNKIGCRIKKWLSFSVLVFLASATLAAEPSTSPSLLSVLESLKQQSYIVIKLKREEDGYEAKVISQEGFLEEIKIPAGKKLSAVQLSSPGLNMSAAIELIQKEGYHDVSSIKVDGKNRYELEALRPQDNKKVEVIVNANTKEIKEETEWWEFG